MCEFYQHPSAPVRFDDPREPPHPDPEIEMMARIDKHLAAVAPADFEPAHLLALRGTLPADHCAACGEPTAQHYDTSGSLWVGCDGVQARRVLAQMVKRPMRDLAVYGDQHPKMSSAILDALRVACGPAMSVFLNTLHWEDRIAISRRLAEVAAIAHLQEQASEAGL